MDLSTLYTFDHPMTRPMSTPEWSLARTACFTALRTKAGSSIWEPCSRFSRRYSLQERLLPGP